MTRSNNIDKGATLQHLAEQGPCEPLEFHRLLRARHNLTKIQATNHAASLVQRGLIRRQVVLTAKGLELLDKLRPGWRMMEAKRLERIAAAARGEQT